MKPNARSQTPGTGWILDTQIHADGKQISGGHGAVEGPRVTGKSVLELDSGVNSRVCEFCDHHRSESMGRF